MTALRTLLLRGQLVGADQGPSHLFLDKEGFWRPCSLIKSQGLTATVYFIRCGKTKVVQRSELEPYSATQVDTRDAGAATVEWLQTRQGRARHRRCIRFALYKKSIARNAIQFWRTWCHHCRSASRSGRLFDMFREAITKHVKRHPREIRQPLRPPQFWEYQQVAAFKGSAILPEGLPEIPTAISSRVGMAVYVYKDGSCLLYTSPSPRD